jgi:uncharacterized iron-regulated membrane protein
VAGRQLLGAGADPAGEEEGGCGRGAGRPAKAGGKSWWARWMPSWRIRWGAGAYKLNFDLHRAGALWIWGVIVIVAFTSFSINLYREVFYPVMSKVSTTTPGPYETLKPAPLGSFIEPRSALPRPSRSRARKR